MFNFSLVVHNFPDGPIEKRCVSNFFNLLERNALYFRLFRERERGGGHIMHLKCLCSIFLEGSVLPFNLGGMGGGLPAPLFCTPGYCTQFWLCMKQVKRKGSDATPPTFRHLILLMWKSFHIKTMMCIFLASLKNWASYILSLKEWLKMLHLNFDALPFGNQRKYYCLGNNMCYKLPIHIKRIEWQKVVNCGSGRYQVSNLFTFKLPK